MGLTAMISFNLNKLPSGSIRTEFYDVLTDDAWKQIREVDTTWWKALASSDYEKALEEATRAFHKAARVAELTEYEVVVHIGYMEPKLIPPLPFPLINEKNQEFINNLGRKQKSVGGR